jgi:short-subunit dehydrogenase
MECFMQTIIDKSRFGPWALITGASSGIGKEFATQIAASGINVVLAARRANLLEEIGAGLSKKYGVQYRTVAVDLSQPGFMDKIKPITDELDVGLLISNAGAPTPSAFLEHDWQQLEQAYNLNAISHMRLTHDFGRRLVKRGKGGILLSGAMGGIIGLPYVANECAAKAAIQSLGEALNVELRPFGIHVTVLVIAPTQTAIIERVGMDASDMPMKPMPVDQCVAEGLQALIQNKGSHINGRINRIMCRIMPTSAMRNMSAKMFTKQAARLRKN